jgi:DNA/RNA-binding domain of Phe-tRNA-synthetase-like protein
MIDLSIAVELKAVAPKVAVGVVTATVTVTQHDESLWQEIDTKVAQVSGQLTTMEEVRKLPPIKATWDAYKALGQDPTRYRGSAEALYRRIIQGKGLYRVNTVVDINNLISLETMCSCGAIDMGKVQPPVVFRVGQEGESYAGIGRGEIKLARIPVFVDTLGPFGSTTSDSERTMVRLDTARVMLLIISFGGREGVDEALPRSVELLRRYAEAREVETKVVE